MFFQVDDTFLKYSLDKSKVNVRVFVFVFVGQGAIFRLFFAK